MTRRSSADAMQRLAFTCGDPAGIGPEVIAAWLAAAPAEMLANISIYGPQTWLATLPKAGRFRGMPVGPANYAAKLGAPDEAGARVADEALRAAAAAARAGAVDAVVTGPVAKVWMARVGWNFPGQTEFFAAEWGGVPVMAFAGGRLRVVLATWHVPLVEVARVLDQKSLERAVAAAAELCVALAADPKAVSPRIAVCGLNPHAGEEGLLGREELEQIDPWLDALRKRHPGLSRTLPGDTVFARQLRGEFDAVVALYHDQGLAPLKTVEFDEAANLTLGLPWVRTSPDHGTAYAIAGRGLASPASFASAVRMAQALVSARGLRGG